MLHFSTARRAREKKGLNCRVLNWMKDCTTDMTLLKCLLTCNRNNTIFASGAPTPLVVMLLIEMDSSTSSHFFHLIISACCFEIQGTESWAAPWTERRWLVEVSFPSTHQTHNRTYIHSHFEYCYKQNQNLDLLGKEGREEGRKRKWLPWVNQWADWHSDTSVFLVLFFWLKQIRLWVFVSR